MLDNMEIPVRHAVCYSSRVPPADRPSKKNVYAKVQTSVRRYRHGEWTLMRPAAKTEEASSRPPSLSSTGTSRPASLGSPLLGDAEAADDGATAATPTFDA